MNCLMYQVKSFAFISFPLALLLGGVNLYSAAFADEDELTRGAVFYELGNQKASSSLVDRWTRLGLSVSSYIPSGNLRDLNGMNGLKRTTPWIEASFLTPLSSRSFFYGGVGGMGLHSQVETITLGGKVTEDRSIALFTSFLGVQWVPLASFFPFKLGLDGGPTYLLRSRVPGVDADSQFRLGLIRASMNYQLADHFMLSLSRSFDVSQGKDLSGTALSLGVLL